MSFFRKVFDFLKSLFTRPGLNHFLERYIGLARDIVEDLARVHDNADFHEWKDEAWRRIQIQTGELRGNWIAILVALAFEELKAKGKV